MRRLSTFLILIVFGITLPGCFARLLTMGGAEVTSMRVLAVEGLEVRTLAGGLSEVRIGGSAARAARMGITAEEVSIFTRSTAEIKAGRLIAADEAAFNSTLSRIKLVRNPGRNPQLYVKNASEPFAEVLPAEGSIRLFNNNTIALRRNIFSVENDIVFVRRDPFYGGDNIVTSLRQGDMVIKLAEQNGWYKVMVLEHGAELTGFLEPALLAPLLILAAGDDEEEESTPVNAIKGEAKQRWSHYWKTFDAVQMTGKDALDLLYADFGSREYNRKISFTVDDWPGDVNTFLKMDYDNIPILSEKDFKDTNLQILGFTKANELLQYINEVHEWVKLSNPLDWGPKNYGDWVQVKTLDGQYGWVFTQPYASGYITGQMVKRVIPVRTPVYEQTDNDNTSNNADKERSGFPVKTILIILVVIIILAAIFKGNG